jgi:hypothetical protein
MITVQVYLIVWQGYIPEKRCTNQTFTTVYFLGVRRLKTSSCIVYDYTTNDLRTCRIYNYLLYVQYTYISIKYVYLFLMHWNCKRLMSIIFGTVHSDRSAIVLQHKYFRSWLSTFCKSINVSTCCMYAAVSESNIMPCVNNSPFSSQLIMSNFSSEWIIIHRFFT